MQAVISATRRVNAKKFREDDELFKFVWERRARRPFSAGFSSQTMSSRHYYILVQNLDRALGGPIARPLSITVDGTWSGSHSTATQWPSPLEVRALPHLKLRAFPTDMSECTGRCVECVSQTLEPVASGCQFR